jgi:ABC-2 type transport system ATP-binding protein
MREMAVTADHIVVVGRGQMLRDMPMRELIAESSRRTVRVRSPQADRLADELRGPDVTVHPSVDGETLEIEGLSTDDIGWAAARAGIPVLELTNVQGSLEDAYMTLTADSVEFRGGDDPQARSEAGEAA